MAKPKVSVIIPVYNRPIQAAHCIRSIQNQDYDDKEIVVIDDCSTDNTWDVLKKIPGLRLIRHKKRMGPGAARNTGVKTSKGKILIFIDSDCLTAKNNWLVNHVKAHESAEGIIVSGIVKGVHNTYGGAVFSYINWSMFMGKKGVITRNYVPLANLSVSRNTFDCIGLFDTTMPIYEDVDWSYRANAKSINFKIIDNAMVHHKNREGLKNVFKYQKQFGMWTTILRKMHPKSQYSWIFPKTLISSIIMCIPLPLLMTLYIAIKICPRHPKIAWYLPGILFAWLGYSWGVVQFFFSGEKRIGIRSIQD
ncbi:MAG: glycosyltransferase [Candidatus Omnitrophica bacterium]|nr:glycosyltransferase [Candidatus Omnitrophota bacterium]